MKESTQDDWKDNSPNEDQNKEDYETMDNYFFGFDPANNVSNDVWPQEEGYNSPTQIKVSRAS